MVCALQQGKAEHLRLSLLRAWADFWWQYAASGPILARKSLVNAQKRGLSGGVRCAAAALLPAEKAHCARCLRGRLKNVRRGY